MSNNLRNEIPEVAEIFQLYKRKRNEARRLLTLLKSREDKFYFLDKMVQPKTTEDKSEDIALEWCIYHLFESIGFKCTKPETDRDVDVKIYYKELSFGIEVKNGNLVAENDMFQAYKYKSRNDENYHPLVIYNNAKYNDSFDEYRIADAEKSNYGILTTKELRKGYVKLLNGKIDFMTFIKQLSVPGEIRFSNKALSGSDKGGVSR